MDAQIALVLQVFEASLRHARHVEVQHELVDVGLEGGKVPAAAADLFELSGSQVPVADIVAVGLAGIVQVRLRTLIIRFGVRDETALHAVGVVSAGVHPEHDGRARVEELAGGDNLISLSFLVTSWRMACATRPQNRREQRYTTARQKHVCVCAEKPPGSTLLKGP